MMTPDRAYSTALECCDLLDMIDFYGKLIDMALEVQDQGDEGLVRLDILITSYQAQAKPAIARLDGLLKRLRSEIYALEQHTPGSHPPC
jgi:hypothetical protein